MKRLIWFTLFLLTSILVTCGSAQTLGELQIMDVPEGSSTPYIVRNPGVSVLIVHSSLPQLSFEGSMGIIRVHNPDPGEFRVFLNPGSQIVTFKSSGYSPAKKTIFIKAKSTYEVRVTPKHLPITADRPQITLQHQLAPGDGKILGTLDGNVLHLDFSNGAVILRPMAGIHTVKLNKGGRVWEKRYELKNGQKVEEAVLFPIAKTEQIIDEKPGSLFITSDPAGAMVFMNEMELGRTPLTLEDVQPGRYELDITRPLYLPSRHALEIQSLVYTPLHVKMRPNFGLLNLKSNPLGALVFLDGKEMGATPLKLQQINAGNHQIRFARANYHEFTDELEIAPGDTLQKTYTLKPKFGSLQVTSTPEGAEVLIDGVYSGLTPLMRDTVLSGSHVLTVKLAHYHEVVDEIPIEDGQHCVRTCDLRCDFGLLSVIADPPGATIRLEGQERQTLVSPQADIMLLPGSYRIKIESPNYETYETVAMIELGEHQLIEPKLARKTGHFKISSKPQLADIYIDGKLAGQTPTVLRDFPTGTYTLRIDQRGYDIFETEVKVEYKKIAEVHGDLSAEGTKQWQKRRNLSIASSVVLPGSGQFISGQNLRGGLYSLVFLAAGISALSASSKHDDEQVAFESAQASYFAERDGNNIQPYLDEMNRSQESMDEQEKIVSRSVAILGIVYAAQLIDVLVWGGGDRPVAKRQPLRMMGGLDVQPWADFSRQNAQVGLTINLRSAE